MAIERLRAVHVPSVAALHATSVTGLLTQLGPAAIRAYYSACAESPLATAFVVTDGANVQGFVLGASSPSALRRDIVRRNGLGIAAAIAAGVFRRPVTIRWLLASVSGPEDGQYDSSAPELTYLAVDPTLRGGGTGRALVEAFAEALRAGGESRFELSVDEGNGAAAAFYERLGMVRLGAYSEFGRRHMRYATILPLAPRRQA